MPSRTHIWGKLRLPSSNNSRLRSGRILASKQDFRGTPTVFGFGRRSDAVRLVLVQTRQNHAGRSCRR